MRPYTALLVVDVQNDFISGSLATANAEELGYKENWSRNISLIQVVPQIKHPD